MAKKKHTEQEEKEIKMLLESNAMYESTKMEAKNRGRGEEYIGQIEFAQQDIIDKLNMLDPEIAKNAAESNRNADSGPGIVQDLEIKQGETRSVFDEIAKIEAETPAQTQVDDTAREVVANEPGTGAQYDIIPLPSNGEGYKNKMSRIPVAYLTAYDENIITSPNLYRDGLVIDFLLKNKIMDKTINTDNLLKGDADAVILFLRATSYGPEFPVTVRDPRSGKYFDTVIDLSQIKSKPFTLKGDENGHFEYKTENGDVIKFKYLTRREEKLLDKLSKVENNGSMAVTVRGVINTLTNCLNNDTVLEGDEKARLTKMNLSLASWAEKLEEKTDSRYTKMITNRMEMQVVSVNGNSDRGFIKDYIHTMRAGDSLKLRRYIVNNEPGMDFEVKIERPEDLGGGSFSTFLEWDDNVFLSIA
jgi:hypothetical protein